jgi:hypothetical protein
MRTKRAAADMEREWETIVQRVRKYPRLGPLPLLLAARSSLSSFRPDPLPRPSCQVSSEVAEAQRQKELQRCRALVAAGRTAAERGGDWVREMQRAQAVLVLGEGSGGLESVTAGWAPQRQEQFRR